MSLELNEEKKSKKKEKNDLGRIADGTYVGIVQAVIDLGDQVCKDWQTGQPLTWEDGNIMIKHKVWITFEFPSETFELTDADENTETVPRILGKEFVVSMHEKSTLRKVIEACNPKATMLDDLVGTACIVTVGSTSGGKAKLTGYTPIMKGVEVPEPMLEPVVFDQDKPDMEVLEKLPKFIQDMAKEGLGIEEAPTTGDDVPVNL